jgi:hypothetical protein
MHEATMPWVVSSALGLACEASCHDGTGGQPTAAERIAAKQLLQTLLLAAQAGGIRFAVTLQFKGGPALS